MASLASKRALLASVSRCTVGYWLPWPRPAGLKLWICAHCILPCAEPAWGLSARWLSNATTRDEFRRSCSHELTFGKTGSLKEFSLIFRAWSIIHSNAPDSACCDCLARYINSRATLMLPRGPIDSTLSVGPLIYGPAVGSLAGGRAMKMICSLGSTTPRREGFKCHATSPIPECASCSSSIWLPDSQIRIAQTAEIDLLMRL
jgi:hypothetical protein